MILGYLSAAPAIEVTKERKANKNRGIRNMIFSVGWKTLPQRTQRTQRKRGKKAGPPAIDRAFGTIDFLTLLDFKNMRKTGALDFIKKND